VETTKGHRRVVPMGQALARTLAKHRETVLAGANDSVFPRPASAQTAVRLLARVAKRLRWPHTVVHDLRRTFAVHALASSTLGSRSAVASHRTPAMTLRYAQHAPEPHMVGLANREAVLLQALLKVVEA
jgi:integrase